MDQFSVSASENAFVQKYILNHAKPLFSLVVNFCAPHRSSSDAVEKVNEYCVPGILTSFLLPFCFSPSCLSLSDWSCASSPFSSRRWWKLRTCSTWSRSTPRMGRSLVSVPLVSYQNDCVAMCMSLALSCLLISLYRCLSLKNDLYLQR